MRQTEVPPIVSRGENLLPNIPQELDFHFIRNNKTTVQIVIGQNADCPAYFARCGWSHYLRATS